MAKPRWLVTGALCALAGFAQAHTHLTAASPAEGSTVKAAERIVLSFSEAARLTALSIQREGGSEQKVSALPSAVAKDLSVTAPPLAPGHYTVSWRVVSNDGHVMSGKLHFTVSGGEPAK